MRVFFAACVVAVLASVAIAQTKPAKPKVELDQSSPAAAVGSYLAAQNAMDFDAIKATIVAGDAKKQATVANPIIIYHMWQLRLERQAIKQFGEENALTVFGHLRTLDKQYELDKKRLRDPSVDYKNNQRTQAAVFLKREKDRPEGLQVDKYRFRDDFRVVKVGDKWFVDYLMTYELDNPEKENEILWLGTVHNKMAAELKKISEQITAGTLKTADDVKLAVDAAEKAAYEDTGTPPQKKEE